MDSPWLTTEEAAEYCRMTPSGIRTAVQRGLLRPNGGNRKRHLYLREALDEYLRGEYCAGREALGTGGKGEIPRSKEDRQKQIRPDRQGIGSTDGKDEMETTNDNGAQHSRSRGDKERVARSNARRKRENTAYDAAYFRGLVDNK